MRFVVAIGLLATAVAAQTGGAYDLSIKNLNGTTRTGDARFTVDATVGEPVAGPASAATPYFVRGGFWAFQQLAPTAASVPVSGRVVMRSGRGISGAIVVLTDLNGGAQWVVTNTFGNFRFDGIAVGQTVVLSVVHRRYSFETSVMAFDIVDAVDDIRFVVR